MEWTIGWWQISVQRVYPTNSELAKTYNQAARRWHQHLQLLGYGRAYRQLWRSLRKGDYLPHGFEPKILCDCGIGTAAFSLAAHSQTRRGVYLRRSRYLWWNLPKKIWLTCRFDDSRFDYFIQQNIIVEQIYEPVIPLNWIDHYAESCSLSMV